MSKNNQKAIHLVPHKNLWKVKLEKCRAGKTFNTKKAAGRYMIKIAREKNMSKVIHGRDGKFQQRRSY